MKMRTAWILTVLLAGAFAAPTAWGQYPPSMGPGGYGPMMGAGMPPAYPGAAMGFMQPGMAAPPGDMILGPGPDPMTNAYGPPAGQPIMGGYPPGGEYGYGEACGPDCECHGFGGRLKGRCHRLLSFFLPYDDGGCCAPHWFDVHAEYVSLRRDEVSETVDFISAGPLGPIVLSTDNLNFDEEEHGFRATFTMQVGVGSNLEFTYLGTHHWNSSAAVSDPTSDLFSAFSEFGVIPLPGTGFTETDQASFAAISYGSNIDNFELNFRQRWQGYGCRLQGSWLAGARYFLLDEAFSLHTQAPINNGEAFYHVGTYNGLFGGQGGGDIWACVLPGLTVGAEGKIGFYFNDASQQTLIAGTTLLTPFEERAEDDFVASMVAEASLMANWRVSQSWTFRGGYTFLYVTGVALAPENFNPTPPFLVPAFQNPPRTAQLDTSGDVFYHGLTAGFEYAW